VVQLTIVSARPPLTLSTEPFHKWDFPDGTRWAAFYRTPSGYLIRFPDLADFEVSPDGRQVTCAPAAPDVSEATAEHLYLHQVLPLALSKRGKLVFHASSVEVAGGAIAFLAESGRGKSTLAASFAVSGYRFLTDDGLVMEREQRGYAVTPGHPSIRLWDDIHQRLLSPNVEKAPPLKHTSKSRFLTGALIKHCDQSRLLRTAYFLGDGTAKEITFRRLNPAQTLVEWLKHSFLLDVEDRTLISSHFNRAARLANEIVCYHLDYPRRYDDLDCLKQAITTHVTSEVVLS
jgi:hypothetical protein